MAGSVNKVTLIGNLGRDPESRQSNGGALIVSFSVATSESWKAANGERAERTEWHNIVCFNEHLGKIAEQYLKKGSKVYLEGQLQTRKYMDKNGVDRAVTEIVISKFRGEIVMLESRGEKPASADARSDSDKNADQYADIPF